MRSSSDEDYWRLKRDRLFVEWRRLQKERQALREQSQHLQRKLERVSAQYVKAKEGLSELPRKVNMPSLMKRLKNEAQRLALLSAMLLASLPVAAQPSNTLEIYWTYPADLVQQFSVDRFEYSIDSAAAVNAGMEADPTVADRYYAPLPALPAGSHTVMVRACNATDCTLWSSPPATFQLVSFDPPTGVGVGDIVSAAPTPPSVTWEHSNQPYRWTWLGDLATLDRFDFRADGGSPIPVAPQPDPDVLSVYQLPIEAQYESLTTAEVRACETGLDCSPWVLLPVVTSQFEGRLDGVPLVPFEPIMTEDGYLVRLPASGAGVHTVELRACTETDCSPWTQPVSYVE